MVKVCNWCGGEFETEYPTKNYCCSAHKRSAKRNRQRVRNRALKTHTRYCAGCTEPFDTHHSQVLYCSQDCRRFYTKHKRKERYIPVPPRKLATKLLEATNGNCGICQSPIDPAIEWPDPRSFSVDHINPIALGGGHEMTNLQPAHLNCNISKGTAT